MPRPKTGERVGAIISGAEKELVIAGFGIYEGDFDIDTPPTPARGGLADMIRASKKIQPHEHPNPRIKLDNGEYIWGCECWWGSEEEVKTMVNNANKRGANVRIASIRDILAENRIDNEIKKKKG